jgi:hypothetical protein
MTIVLLTAHSRPKVIWSEPFIVEAGAKDNLVFDDHVSPKGDRIDAGRESKQNKVCGRTIDG